MKLSIDPNIPDKELLDACIRGDGAAMSLFVERYRKLVYFAIHKWISKYAAGEKAREDTEEIFQETFLTLMKNGFFALRSARDPQKLSPLVAIISQNVTGRYFKKKWKEEKRRVEKENVGTDPVIDPPPSITLEEIFLLLDKFLDLLENEERNVFELRFAHGMKYADIGDELGLSSTNVGVMIMRLKKRFTDFLKSMGMSPEDIL